MLMVYSAHSRISENKCKQIMVQFNVRPFDDNIVLFRTLCNCVVLFPDPLIVRRLMSLLSNEIVSDVWISQAIFNLKEEWMQ